MNNAKANVLRVQGLRSSNAATAIPSRKIKRQGTRSSVKRAAMREFA